MKNHKPIISYQNFEDPCEDLEFIPWVLFPEFGDNVIASNDAIQIDLGSEPIGSDNSSDLCV